MSEDETTETSRDAPRARLLPKSRLDAFTDGVLAIVITLLVLELEVPEESTELLAALAEQWASYLAYIVSFVFVGGIWLAHVDLTRFIKRSDSVFMRLNLVMLLFVSFLPFTTTLAATHLTDAGERVAVVIFGLDLLLASLMMSALAVYVARHRDLVADEVDTEEAHAFVRRRWVGVVVMGAATAIGLVAPSLAVALYVIATLTFVVEPLVRLQRS
jgi:uncharacterized membrane protein